MPLLYHRVYLHRVGQLCALVKVLEDGSRRYDGTGLASGSATFMVGFWCPRLGRTVYYKNVIRLLALCTSTRSFSWAIEWGKPNLRRSGSGHPRLPQYSTINLLRHSQPSMLPIFSSLQKLTFTLDESSLQEIIFIDVKDTFAFQNLEDLTCEATEAKFLEGLAVVSQSFLIPKLQHLSINTTEWDYLTDLQVTAIFRLLESHGEKLSSLALDFPITTEIGIGVSDILRRTPNLRTLSCFTRAFRPIDTKTITAAPVPNLEKLKLFTSEYSISCSDLNTFAGSGKIALEQFLEMASSSRIFPSLRTIAIYGLSSPDLPMDFVLAPLDHKEAYTYLTAWTKKFREMGVSLIGVDDELIAPENPGPGRWTGRNATDEDDEWDEEEDEHTDSEDLSFDSDEVSYRDESSEYSASDSDSDDGGWSWEVSGSEVGSVEALEIFENTVQVRSFTRLHES